MRAERDEARTEIGNLRVEHERFVRRLIDMVGSDLMIAEPDLLELLASRLSYSAGVGTFSDAETRDRRQRHHHGGMHMDLIYLAHPVRPRLGSTDTVNSNLESSRWWLYHLQRANPGVAFVSQWLLEMTLGLDEDSNPQHRTDGIARCIAMAGCGAIAGVAICGTHIGSGSMAETHAVGSSSVGIVPAIHRFINRGQNLILPDRRDLRWCDFSEATPYWLRRCQFGAAPESVELVGAEILAAIERDRLAS
jgi:hypothetical protein